MLKIVRILFKVTVIRSISDHTDDNTFRHLAEKHIVQSLVPYASRQCECFYFHSGYWIFGSSCLKSSVVCQQNSRANFTSTNPQIRFGNMHFENTSVCHYGEGVFCSDKFET